MEMRFTKMHGLGNDFIVIDSRKGDLRNLPSVVKRLSDRRFGVGFDQALVLKNSRKADFRMDVYNSDGSRVEMCGNGIRCLARYIWDRGLKKREQLRIETLAGIIKPGRAGKNLVAVDMGYPVFEGKLIPVKRGGSIADYPLKVSGRVFKISCVGMGNPHCVIFVKDVDGFPVERYGEEIEKHGFFPKKTNVEFVQVLDPGRLKVRVWERGCGETLACGTGACASAVISNLKGFTGKRVKVILKGGSLKIELAKDNRVLMTGPAEEVFEGVVEI